MKAFSVKLTFNQLISSKTAESRRQLNYGTKILNFSTLQNVKKIFIHCKIQIKKLQHFLPLLLNENTLTCRLMSLYGYSLSCLFLCLGSLRVLKNPSLLLSLAQSVCLSLSPSVFSSIAMNRDFENKEKSYLKEKLRYRNT